MSDLEKAQCILRVLMRFSEKAVHIKPENILEKCGDSGILNFYYYKLCRRK